jgi:hypothetical protein
MIYRNYWLGTTIVGLTLAFASLPSTAFEVSINFTNEDLNEKATDLHLTFSEKIPRNDIQILGLSDYPPSTNTDPNKPNPRQLTTYTVEEPPISNEIDISNFPPVATSGGTLTVRLKGPPGNVPQITARWTVPKEKENLIVKIAPKQAFTPPPPAE